MRHKVQQVMAYSPSERVLMESCTELPLAKRVMTMQMNKMATLSRFMVRWKSSLS